MYNLRIYQTAPGKREAVVNRFRDHVFDLFKKNGVTVKAFWTDCTDPDRLFYITWFKDQDDSARAWAAFQNDPEWQKVKAESEKDGKLVVHVDMFALEETEVFDNGEWK